MHLHACDLIYCTFGRIYISLMPFSIIYHSVSFRQSQSFISLIKTNFWLQEDPFGTAGSLSDEDREMIRQQKIPTLAQFLDFANETNKAVMFDVRLPPWGHPYASSALDIVIQTVKNSSFDVSKVRLLAPAVRNYINIKVLFTVSCSNTTICSFLFFSCFFLYTFAYSGLHHHAICQSDAQLLKTSCFM